MHSNIDTGSYQKALDILDNRIKCGPEIPKSRLSHYYATRSLCYAHLGNIAESMRDYQLILSFKKRKSFGRIYRFRPETYLDFILKESQIPIASKRYQTFKQHLLKSSIGNSYFGTLGMPDQIMAKVEKWLKLKRGCHFCVIILMKASEKVNLVFEGFTSD